MPHRCWLTERTCYRYELRDGLVELEKGTLAKPIIAGSRSLSDQFVSPSSSLLVVVSLQIGRSDRTGATYTAIFRRPYSRRNYVTEITFNVHRIGES